MKTLTLKNGKTYQITDRSNQCHLEIQVGDFAEIDDIKADITKENLSEFAIGTVEYQNIIPTVIGAHTDESGDTFATFYGVDGTEKIVQDAIDTYTEMLIDEGVI